MRHDDLEQKRYFRSSERVFRMNGAWFFAAREGDQGPYASHNEADREVSRYVHAMTELVSFQRKRDPAPARPAKIELSLEPLEHSEDTNVTVLPRRVFI